jgi:hypothetical protein
MSDQYETLIRRYVNALDVNSPTSREALYSRIRVAQISSLHRTPTIAEEQYQIEKQKLEDAIKRFELQNFPQPPLSVTDPFAMTPLLTCAVIVLIISGLAALFGFSYLGAHQMEVIANAYVPNPVVMLAIWSAILGTIVFLVGIGLLIGGFVQKSNRSQ